MTEKKTSLTLSDGQTLQNMFTLDDTLQPDYTAIVPAPDAGTLLLQDAQGQPPSGLFLSRRADDLQLHAAQDTPPMAVIQSYFTSPVLLTVPQSGDTVAAVDKAAFSATAEELPVSLLAAVPDVPGAPGYILIDGVTDDQGNITGEIAGGGMTDDLRPTLHGEVPHGEGMTLSIYANTVLLGTAIVGDDGTWTFTPPKDFEPDASYTFEVLFRDSGGGTVFVSMPFTVVTGEDGTTPAENLPEPGNRGGLNISGVNDDNGLHTGEVINGGITDDLTPTLTGHNPHAAGQILKIYANTVLLGSVVADDNGDWNFTPTLAPDSQYTFEVLLQDPGGGSIVLSMPYTITTGFDYAAPVITLGYDDVGTERGGLASGQATDDATPELRGTADAGVTVNIYDGKTLLGSTVAAADGSWSFTPAAALSNGIHDFTATATDGTHETVHSDTFSLDIETAITPPTAATDITLVDDVAGGIVGELHNNDVTNDNIPTLSGKAEAGMTVIVKDNGTVIGSTTADGNGNWTFEPASALAEGKHSFSTVVENPNNGSQSDASAAIAVTVDTVIARPIISVFHDDTDESGVHTNGETSRDNTPTLDGIAEAGSVVVIYEGDKTLGSTTAGSDGRWSFTSPVLADGTHTFMAVAKDAAGNISDPSGEFALTVTTDIIPPDAPQIIIAWDDVGDLTGSVDNNGSTDDSTPGFFGYAEAGSVVRVYADGTLIGSVVAIQAGAWDMTEWDLLDGVSLSDGRHVFTATATDAAGNTSTASAPFVLNIDTSDLFKPDAATDITLVDDVAGGITGELHNNDVTNDNIPTLSGKAEAGMTVIVKDNGTVIGSTTADGNGNWTFEPASALAEGKHSFSTVVKNPNNGSQSDASAAIAVTVDTHTAMTITGLQDNAGTVTGLVGNGGVTDDNSPVITGTAEPGSIVYIQSTGVYGESNSFTVTADSSGNWTLPQGYSDYGTFSYSAYSVDAAGNRSDTVTFHVEFVAENQDDTSVPDAATGITLVDDVAGGITGELHNNDVTNDNIPTLSGKAEAGMTVIVKDNGTVIGST
ncbi:Ig-like domain-containing protein, partial [Klebsiella aerogenes]